LEERTKNVSGTFSKQIHVVAIIFAGGWSITLPCDVPKTFMQRYGLQHINVLFVQMKKNNEEK
jgi:hypothetical protein